MVPSVLRLPHPPFVPVLRNNTKDVLSYPLRPIRPNTTTQTNLLKSPKTPSSDRTQQTIDRNVTNPIPL